MSLLTPLLDLLFPPRCVLCRDRVGIADAVVLTCDACLETIPQPQNCCGACGHPLADEYEDCVECRGKSFSFSGACAVNLYRGELKKTIHRYKYRGTKELAEPLGRLVARQVRRSNWPEVEAVIPVPLNLDRIKERGYDQALLLAHVVADDLKLPVKQVLVRKRPTLSQTKLSANDRWSNVSGAFVLVPDACLPKRVLLVDDILTTGATAHFAGVELLRAGVSEIYLAVVAR